MFLGSPGTVETVETSSLRLFHLERSDCYPLRLYSSTQQGPESLLQEKPRLLLPLILFL